MAFADLLTNYGALSIGLFVRVTVENVSDGSTQTFRWTDAQTAAGDWVGEGSVEEWDGRIRGQWTVEKIAPKINEPKWTHPRCKFKVAIGGSDDAIWDYLGDDWLWPGASADVWLVDMGQAAGSGYRKQVSGAVRNDVIDASLYSEFGLEIVGNYYNYNVQLPGNQVARSTRWGSAGFIQPARANADGTLSSIGSAIGSADTLIKLSQTMMTPGYKDGDVAVINSEVVFIKSAAVSGGAEYWDVVRGYLDSTEDAHAANSLLYVFRGDPHAGMTLTDRYDKIVPFVFGQTGVNRGIVVKANTLAKTQGYASGWNECWYARGKCSATVGYVNSGGVWDARSGVNMSNYDDIANPWNGVGPTSWGGHFVPHILPVGSYITLGQKVSGYVRCHGAYSGADLLRYPDGIAKYLMENSGWALGETSAVNTSQVQGVNSGGWAGEFTEDYWDHISGIVPKQDATEPARAMDVIQELADIVNSDMFTREGTLTPKRRTAPGTATYTIDDADVVGAHPKRIKPKQDLYCNDLTAEYDQPVYLQPVLGGSDAPDQATFNSRFRDKADIASRGAITAKVNRKWWRFHLAAVFPVAGDGTASFVKWWEDAHAELFEMRNQPQIWMEASLSPRFLPMEQGEAIDFDTAQTTDRVGQIRDIVIKGGGGKAPDLTARSWHIDFG